MLVLSRKRNEQIVITVPPSSEPTVIVATCVDIRGDKTRTGWEAPESVGIYRREIADAREREELLAVEEGAAA